MELSDGLTDGSAEGSVVEEIGGLSGTGAEVGGGVGVGGRVGT